MLILYEGKGASEFEITSPFIEGDALNNILFTVSQLLASRGEQNAVEILKSMEFRLSNGANYFKDDFLVLHASIPVEPYENLRKLHDKFEWDKDFRKPYNDIASVFEELGFNVRFIACTLNISVASGDWKSYFSFEKINNQALFIFNDSPKLSHKGLNFRSKTEIKIYETLVKKGLLIMPLPVIIMGSEGNKKEPDFVICYKGKVGILEIHGDKWHPPETAAQEHERRRLFTKLGVTVYEIFGAERCWNDPDGVVKDFIQAFT
jgi:hypothetical protein